ncbi:MAG: alpha/beta hydrolase [Tidjanibacter sp.]|nr:alpha/beta hydrolase [Tidjanibacter sp.]
MRRLPLLLFALLTLCASVCGQKVERKTYTFTHRGDTPLQLDLYSTSPEQVQPCLVYVFGGAFIAGSRYSDGLLDVYEYFARRGWKVVAIDYRLGLRPLIEKPTVKRSVFDFRSMLMQAVDMAAEDLLEATAYLVSNASQLAINPEKIVTMGSSAGGIAVCQAEWAICSGDVAAAVLPADFNYAGVISMAGAIMERGRRLRWERTPCPMLLCHGNADRNVPYGRQSLFGVSLFGSEAISKSLEKAGISHWFYDVCKRGHSLSWRPMYEQRDLIESFLTREALGCEGKSVHLRVDDPALPNVRTNFGLLTYIKSNFGGRTSSDLEIVMD